MTSLRRLLVVLLATSACLAALPIATRAQVVRIDRTDYYEFRRPIIRIGQDYTLKPNDEVRQIVVVSGNVTVEGRVRDDVVVVLGDVNLASTAVVEGSVVAVGGAVTVAPGATINHDMVVVGGTADSPPAFSPRGEHIVIGVPLLGDQLRGVVPWLTRGLLWGRLIVPDLGWVWWIVAIFFLISLVLNVIFDKPVRMCVEVVQERPLAALLAGLLVLMLFGPVMIIMAATVIGLAVIPFVVCALLVAWRLGKIGVTRAMGAGLVRQSDPQSRSEGVRSFVIGFGLLCLAYMVPVLGLVMWAMVGVIGLGAATIVFARAIKRESPKKVTPAPVMPPTSGDSGDFAGAPASAATITPEPPAAPPPIVETPVSRPSMPFATFLDRVAAFVLDCLLVAIADRMLRLTHGDGTFFLLLLVYHVAFVTWMGTTLGGIVVGIQVVRVSGTKVRFIDTLVRALSSLFSLAALGIGCLWMLQDPDHQMWHDKIAGTYVVRVPRNVLLEAREGAKKPW